MSKKVANLNERKNTHPPVYGVEEFVYLSVCLSICLSVTNFDLNYLRTGEIEILNQKCSIYTCWFCMSYWPSCMLCISTRKCFNRLIYMWLYWSKNIYNDMYFCVISRVQCIDEKGLLLHNYKYTLQEVPQRNYQLMYTFRCLFHRNLNN